ncbi:MAG: glycerate kinase [Bacteroidaceae bacterium]|nr:glycerate kinase [Bacteroidaceae bacterium]
MKIAVAFDSFKGSLTSAEAAKAFTDGFSSVLPDTEFVTCIVADGGEGSIKALASAESVTVEKCVSGPLHNRVKAHYLIDNNCNAIIEMAEASGLTLIPVDERNPMKTTSAGTGELILDALQRGCSHITLCIGGSATNDAGTGLLSALGYRFMDADGKLLYGCGASLKDIARIDDSNVPTLVRDADYTIICDVTAPFCGPDGAACTFAAQKGADSNMIHNLDSGMNHFADVIYRQYGINIKDISGAGAAGGIGGGLLAILGAELKSGTDYILEKKGFGKMIEGCSLVVTGEGHIDRQTIMQKAPMGVLRMASAHSIPVIAIGGKVTICKELEDSGFSQILSITPHSMPLQQAMEPATAYSNLFQTAAKLAKSMQNI